MEARAKLLGHAIHAMLIPYPLALLTTVFIFDVIRVFSGNPFWATMAYWMIFAGVVGGLAAAFFGLIDWFAIPKATRARRVGVLHGLGNLVAVLLFAAAWWIRGLARDTSTTTLAMEIVATALILVTAWLGGELVERHGVAVHDGANVDAPHSLSGRPARDTTR